MITRSSTRVGECWPSYQRWILGGARNRAIWVPAGTQHAHRAYSDLELRLVGLPTTENPLGLDAPTVVAVSPLLRELILVYTADPDQHTAERTRLLSVLLDQLRASPQQPQYLLTPTEPLLIAVAQVFQADPADNRTLTELGRQVGASDRSLSRLFRRDLGMTFLNGAPSCACTTP